MSNGLIARSFVYSSEICPANQDYVTDFSQVVLDLISKSKTALSDDSPYFTKLREFIRLIAEQYTLEECELFLKRLDRLIANKKINKDIFLQLEYEFIHLIENKKWFKKSNTPYFTFITTTS